MTQLLTPNFRTWCARQFVASVSGRENSFVSESISRYVADQYVANSYVTQTSTVENIFRDANCAVADIGYFYMFAGLSDDWVGEISTPTEAISDYHYGTYDTLSFGKKIEADDVSYMINRYDWVSDTVYAEYDDKDPTLFQKQFYVVTEEGNEYHIFKCVNNNNGAASTHKPSVFEYNNITGDVVNVVNKINNNYYYQTTDGYVWLYMYSIPNQTFKKFSTDEYVPLMSEFGEINLDIGTIQSIRVSDPGAYHLDFLRGEIKKSSVNGDSKAFYLNTVGTDFFDVANFYVGSSIYITDNSGAGQIRTIVQSGIEGNERLIRVDEPFTKLLDSSSAFEIAPGVSIVGDGTGAQARAVIEDKRIKQIDIINPGRGYSYANVSISSTTGYYDTNNIFVQTDTVGQAAPVIAPPYGHTRNIQNELFADKVCISVDFEGNSHPITDFAQYGLLVNPLFPEIDIVVTDVTPFNIGETIFQPDNATYGILTSVDDATSTLTITNVRGVFAVGSVVEGLSTSGASDILSVSNDFTTFEVADLIDNSGEILAIKNTSLVERADGQTERVRLIIDF